MDYESYELEIGIYEDAFGGKTPLLIVVEFEQDADCGLIANYYLTTPDADREFFDHTRYKFKEAPKDSEKKWMETCAKSMEADFDNGAFSLDAVTNYLEKCALHHNRQANKETEDEAGM